MNVLDYTYHSPDAFWLLLLLPLVLAWFIWRKNRASVKLSTTPFAPHHKGLNILRPILIGLQLLALTAFIIALARPQLPLSSDKVIKKEIEGIDIVIALDISESMLTEDFSPNRLEASKKVGIEFIKNRSNDRIGLVVYGSEAYTQCPLTSDYGMVKELFENVEYGSVEGGTAIGLGLATAINRLKDSKAKSKVIILLSDGENNQGEIHPLTAADIAKDLGIRVYTIGVGSKGKVKVPVGRTIFGDIYYDYVDVNIDEKMLTQIAEKTGGQYRRATDKEKLKEIYAEIDRLEKQKISTIEYHVDLPEMGHLFILLGLGCLALNLLISKLLFRSISIE